MHSSRLWQANTSDNFIFRMLMTIVLIQHGIQEAADIMNFARHMTSWFHDCLTLLGNKLPTGFHNR